MCCRQKYYLLALLLAMLASSCDFPADPPLKSTDGTINPPVADTVKSLLPLTGTEAWTYLVDPRGRPFTQPKTVTPRLLERDGQKFYFLPYLHNHGSGITSFAFPTLLRNDTLGLGFYQPFSPDDTLRLSRMPRHMFTLPYPARKGTISRFGDFKVMCTHTDTLMYIISTFIQIPTHRYEIWRQNNPQSVIYAIPGVALLRIDIEDLAFHSVGWRI